MVRHTIHFSGRVQGVGFRFTAREIARPFAMSGFVENLEDGRVRLVAEGDAEEIARFLAALERRMSGNIRERTVAESPATGEFGKPGEDPLTIRR